MIEGTVRAPVHSNPSDGRHSFQVEHQEQLFECLVIGWDKKFRVLPGDVVRGPGCFPEQTMRLVRGRRPQVRTTHDALSIAPPSFSPWHWQRLATACRLTMQAALLAAVPGEAGRLLCLLTLGSGPRLANDLPAAHRATGLSHLLAVSGAHLTMLAWMLAAVAAAYTRRSPLGNPWFRRGCISILILYGAITGLQPPMFRAVVATTVFFLAAGRGRRTPIGAVLCLPAILTALLAPRDLFSISFNLSYAAVIGLLLSRGFDRHSTYQRWIQGPAVCSAWASLCTMPFTLWYFGRFAPWTIVATPILSPIVAGLLGLALIVASLSEWIPYLGWLLSFPLALTTEIYSTSVRALACLPLAPVFAITRPEPLLLLSMGMIGGLGLLYWRDRRGVAALCIMLSIPHFLPHPTRAVHPGLRLLAVGHGHAALLHLPDGTRALVDCGTLGTRGTVIRQVAEAVLPHRQIDWLIVTHGDQDHIGCIVPLLDRVVIAQALLPSEMQDSEVANGLQDQGCQVQYLKPGEGQTITPGLLVHRPATSGDRNDQSAWIHADFDSFRAILPGDALAIGVGAWLSSKRAEAAEVLVLPHHGRAHPAIHSLLQVVSPDLALVSSAASDGLSVQSNAARSQGCQVLHTSIVGHIEVRATDPPSIYTEFPLRLDQRRR
jgi:competence protein ComEC